MQLRHHLRLRSNLQAVPTAQLRLPPEKSQQQRPHHAVLALRGIQETHRSPLQVIKTVQLMDDENEDEENPARRDVRAWLPLNAQHAVQKQGLGELGADRWAPPCSG